MERQDAFWKRTEAAMRTRFGWEGDDLGHRLVLDHSCSWNGKSNDRK